MKLKTCAALVAVLSLLALAGCGSGGPDTSQPPEQPPTSQPVEQPEDDPAVKYGDLLELNDNRETKGVVVVKAKISPSTTNKLTVEQNFHNVVDLVKNQGFDNCELQYWAVADMSNGSEDKVISFTVPQDVVEQVASGDVVATELQDLVVDLWILPSLKN